MPLLTRSRANRSPGRPTSRSGWNNASTSRPATPSYHQDAEDNNTPVAAAPTSDLDVGLGLVISRAYFYDVVLEGEGDDQHSEICSSASILPHLGNELTGVVKSRDASADTDIQRSDSSSSITAIARGSKDYSLPSSASTVQKDAARFMNNLTELVTTERSYVKKLEILHNCYAVPLGQLADDRDTAIISAYEVNRLFGHVGQILSANKHFLKELLELVGIDPLDNDAVAQYPHSHTSMSVAYLQEHVGDIVYRNIVCFQSYEDYLADYEAAKKTQQALTRTKGFREFIDRTKLRTHAEIGNVGLSELIVEPVQRIPRYKLLLDGMIKSLPQSSLQRARLEQSVGIANRIASYEADDATKKAAIFKSFLCNIDGFPPELISASREFIDCIDVDDFPIDSLGGTALFSPGGNANLTLHCTLFLFEDRLVIVKRPNSTASGRRLLGLDDLNRLADLMTNKDNSSNKCVELKFRGMVNIMDVSAADLGGTEFRLSFARPPSYAATDRWANRQTRQFVATEHPFNSLAASRGGHARTASAYMPASMEKARFLENLWRAQALLKTGSARGSADGQARCQMIPAARSRQSAEGSSTPEPSIRKLVYWNICSRRAYMDHDPKSAAVLHVDLEQESADLSFGSDGARPHAVLRIVSMDETHAECSFVENVKGNSRDEEIRACKLSELASRMEDLVSAAAFDDNNQCDFRPMTPSSIPSTPASHRGRVVMGLENLGRNLFNATPSSIRGRDVFGSPLKRTKSNASKSTMNTSSDLFSTVHSRSTNTSYSSRANLSAYTSAPGGSKFATPGAPMLMQHHRSMSFEQRDAHAASPLFESHDPTPKRHSRPLEDHHMSPSTPLREHARKRAQSTPAQDVRASETPAGTPTGCNFQRSPSPQARSPSPGRGLNTSPSPVRRKPVPPQLGMRNSDETARSTTTARAPIRVPSGSKRGAPAEELQAQSSKRAACLSPDQVHSPVSVPVQPTSRAAVSAPTLPDISRLSPAPAPVEPDSQDLAAEALGRRVLRNLERAQDEETRMQKAVGQIRAEVHALRGSIKRKDVVRIARGGGDGQSPLKMHANLVHTNGTQDGPAVDLAQIEERMRTIEHWLHDVDDRFDDAGRTQQQLRSDTKVLTERYRQDLSARSAPPPPPPVDVKAIRKEAADEVRKLRTQVEGLTRRCELLTTLEADGRMENTELHRAFNEELDQMYEHTQKPELVELQALREEMKRVKAERNELNVQNKALRRDLALEKQQNEVYRSALGVDSS